MIEDRDKRARIRSCEAAVTRLNRAASAVTGAMVQEMLEDDEFARRVGSAKYQEAEEQCHGALALIHDSRRSIDGVARDEEGEREERMIGYLATMEKAIDDFLKAEIAGTPRDGLPFHRLDEARLLPPDLLAAVRNRQEQM